MEQELIEAGWTEDSAAMARLVAMEHLMNVVDHAGVPQGEECECRLTLEEGGSICGMLFRDTGRKWIPEPVGKSSAHRLPLDETSERGRGLQMIQALTSRSQYFRRDGWNHHLFHISREVGNLPLTLHQPAPGEVSYE
jgi:anti-sigma regulatory factor (Ser/Thr protein kinase)